MQIARDPVALFIQDARLFHHDQFVHGAPQLPRLLLRFILSLKGDLVQTLGLLLQPPAFLKQEGVFNGYRSLIGYRLKDADLVRMKLARHPSAYDPHHFVLMIHR